MGKKKEKASAHCANISFFPYWEKLQPQHVRLLYVRSITFLENGGEGGIWHPISNQH